MARKKKPVLNVSFLLDMTGSMGSVKDATISGFNEYIGSLKARGDDIRFTLTLFNSNAIKTLYKGATLSGVKPLDAKTYKPDNTTPLYDAVVQTVSATQKSLSGAEQDVLFVVMTDGEENASTQYNRQKVFDLIKKKEAEGWTFAFLGANQEPWQVGASIGVAMADSAMNYDPAQPAMAFRALDMATADYAANPQEAKKRGVFHRAKKDNTSS